MAELRRVGGSMEPRRAFASPRVLLPSEIQIIEALGLTEDEYWEFLRLNDEYNGKRKEAYAYVPDVQNDPITPILVNLVIGIALTAVAALIAPKPRTPEQKRKLGPLKTEDQTSASRFAPQSSFDSLQQLAQLGSPIPLIYTKQRTHNGETYGGVRANSTLLWSYLVTLGRSQQLRALLLFSHGKIKGRPDFKGYAIGDLLLADYALGKVALYFKDNMNGGRFLHSDVYPDGEMEPPFDTSKGSDPFAFKWANGLVQFSSGSRTPNTQAVFGHYACLPNANMYKVNYELVMKPDSADGDVEDDIRDRKRKIKREYPRYGYVFNVLGRSIGIRDNEAYDVGDTVVYALAPNQFSEDDIGNVEEIRQSIDNARIEADSNLVVGDTYLVGTGYGVLVKKEGSPWRIGNQVTAYFRMTTAGLIDVRGGNGDGQQRPVNLSIQRMALATISNTRACDRTDITVKSTVYRKINGFANVNSQPSDATIGRYNDNDANIQLGRMNIYTKRLSFFALQYRKQGDTDWINITSANSSFVVEGRSPEAVYNQISIIHPELAAYDFQLAPIAGAAAARFWMDQRIVYVLDASGSFDDSWKQPSESSFSKDGFFVWYTGYEKVFDSNSSYNKEWEVYGVPEGTGENGYGDGIVQYGETVNLRYGDGWQDFVVYDTEQPSNQTAPEHEVVNVNEITAARINGAGFTPVYDDLAYAGIRLNSGVEWTNFSQLSAYFKDGIEVEKLLPPFGTDSTNLFPEIVFDLLINKKYGLGESVGKLQINRDEMQDAAQFCLGNQFFWDGVIGERVNVRDWIFENAGYCLLQFRIKGGQFSLYPDVPFDSSGQIDVGQKIYPKALFTDGNVTDLQVSFLTPEERQLFRAVVLWRKEAQNSFPETKTLGVRLTDEQGGSESDIEETFDMSYFCTSQKHAEFFAKYALKIRQQVDHGIKFQTTPQMAMGLEPGEYFQVASAVAHSDSSIGSLLNNGSIDNEGNVIGLDLENGTYQVQYWRPGTTGIAEATLTVIDGQTSNFALRSSIFAVSLQNNPQHRVYKLESLSYADDGLVEVAGSFAPLTSTGSLRTLDWGGVTNSHFIVDAS